MPVSHPFNWHCVTVFDHIPFRSLFTLQNGPGGILRVSRPASYAVAPPGSHESWVLLRQEEQRVEDEGLAELLALHEGEELIGGHGVATTIHGAVMP